MLALLNRFAFGRFLAWTGRALGAGVVLDWLLDKAGAFAGYMSGLSYWLFPALFDKFFKSFGEEIKKATEAASAPAATMLRAMTGLPISGETLGNIITGGLSEGERNAVGNHFADIIFQIFNVDKTAAGYANREPGLEEQLAFERFIGRNAQVQLAGAMLDVIKSRMPEGLTIGLGELSERMEKILGFEDAQEEILEPLMEKLIIEGLTKRFNRTLKPTDLTPSDAIEAVIRGLLDDGTAQKILDNEGIRQDIRPILVNLKKNRLSDSDIGDMYERDIWTWDDVFAEYRQAGYMDDEARMKANLVRDDRLWKLKNELVNCKEQQYAHGVIDESAFRSFLSMAGYDQQEEDIQVEIAKCKMSLGKKPSEKQITGTFNVTNPKASAGGASVMSWNIRNATRVTITDIGEVEPRGEILVYPTETRTYYLDASSDTDQERFSAVVIVPGTVEKKRPTVTFGASPGRVDLGRQVELKWTTSNADAVSIDGIGPVAEAGVQIVMPLVTTIYTIRATNALGATVRQDAVFVNLPDFDFNRDLRPGLSFSITPTVIKTTPPQAEMKWSISRAEKGEITDPGGNKIDVGRAGAILIHPSESGIYTLTASNLYGESKAQEAAIVETSDDGPPPPPPDTIPPTVTISATPQTVRPGETVFVSWFISGAATGEVSIPNRALRQVGPTGSDTWQAPPTPGNYEFVVRATNVHGTSSHAAYVVVSG